MQDRAQSGSWASYSPSWETQSIAEVSGESPGIRFKPCHYKSPSAKQFVRQLITAVKQRSHGAILRTEGKAVATGERRLGDKSKANMPKLIGQKSLNLPPMPAAWQERTAHGLWAGAYVRASARSGHADILQLLSALAPTGGLFSHPLQAGCLLSCPRTRRSSGFLQTHWSNCKLIYTGKAIFIAEMESISRRSDCCLLSWCSRCRIMQEEIFVLRALKWNRRSY